MEIEKPQTSWLTWFTQGQNKKKCQKGKLSLIFKVISLVRRRVVMSVIK